MDKVIDNRHFEISMERLYSLHTYPLSEMLDHLATLEKKSQTQGVTNFVETNITKILS